jgi:hypothetical protein
MRALILFSILSISGCASSSLNSSCAHVNAGEMTVPYIGGKGNADVYACHMGCVGSKCPIPDYASLQTLTSDYLKSTGNKITTSGPGTIEFVPSK